MLIRYYYTEQQGWFSNLWNESKNPINHGCSNTVTNNIAEFLYYIDIGIRLLGEDSYRYAGIQAVIIWMKCLSSILTEGEFDSEHEYCMDEADACKERSYSLNTYPC